MFSIFPLFVPALKDYIDILNNAYDSVLNDNNLQQLLQQSIIYLISSIKFLVIYFFSFQWLQDLTYLPVVVPEIKLEILKENFFLQTPESNFFTFLEIPSYANNKFFLGFANSFFLCLPISVAHIISIRRLLIQGIYAGFFASLGTMCGQILLLTCILFGGRFFITPWFNFQVLNYFIGIWVVLKIIYDMAHERSIRIIDSSNIATLTQIFLLNFILGWTEQSCILQYFGNLTFAAEPSIIEIFSSLTKLQSILAHITYIIGIIVGSILFTSLFVYATLNISNLCVKLLSILYSRWIRRLNFALITLIIAFTFTSIPFYSFDYLILSNFGLVSQDEILKQTIFSNAKIADNSYPILGDRGNEYANQKPGIDTDSARFNKARYLMFDINDSFEQLNYQGEYAWLTHRHYVPSLSKQLSSSPAISVIIKRFEKTNTFKKNTSNRKKNSVKSNEVDTADSNLTDSNKFLDFRQEFRSYKYYTDKEAIEQGFEQLINTSFLNRFTESTKIKVPKFEKKFKQKYYSNPIYKLLLATDIDTFLARQPRSFSLSQKQQQDLFKNRIVLSKYYDSLRYYNELPKKKKFQKRFAGSKTYADRIYNHQFNGTLKIVRRLFSINADLTENFLNDNLTSINHENSLLSNNPANTQINLKQNSNQIEKNLQNADAFVLKFDQPLYKNITKNNYSNLKNIEAKIENKNTNKKKLNNSVVEQLQSSIPLRVSFDNCFFHEELSIKHNKFKYHDTVPQINKSFIELTNPIPFYVGWDEQLRKLVITNRLSANYLAGESMKFSNKNSDNNYYTLNKLVEKNKTINFTTWPLSKNALENLKLENRSSYNLLYDSMTKDENRKKVEDLILDDINFLDWLTGSYTVKAKYNSFKAVPSNIYLNGRHEEDASMLKDIIPYTRGGFVWPGHETLKFKFKKLPSL